MIEDDFVCKQIEKKKKSQIKIRNLMTKLWHSDKVKQLVNFI